MKDSILATPAPTTTPGKSVLFPYWTRFTRKLVLGRLRGIQYGQIILIEGEERLTFGRQSADCPLNATLFIHDPRFYHELAFAGSVGAGEAYMDAWWSCDDLTTLVRLMILNLDVLDRMETGLARASAPIRKFFHGLRRNTKIGSQRNIAAHYDLGNDFFSLMLDDTLTYSCGIFERTDSTLRDASIAKIDRICQKLQLSPTDQVLEIGTGWGSFALHAAHHYGCQVTTTTISQQQYELARKRVAEAGLTDRITVLCQDYRDLHGQYDKLVSIEMIEAVGHLFFERYFQCCSRLLKPEGMMLLQTITIADQRYEQMTRAVDFIQRYIFPGGCLPSITAICNTLTQTTDLRLFHLEDITPHYATTLCEWRERFFANLSRIRALGYSDTFVRMWEFYLCYCEGGFLERAIGDVQLLLTKPGCRREPILSSLPSLPGLSTRST